MSEEGEDQFNPDNFDNSSDRGHQPQSDSNASGGGNTPGSETIQDPAGEILVAEEVSDKPVKSEMEFNSLGILTLWLLPAVFVFVYSRIPGLWFLMLFATIIYKIFLEDRSIPILNPLINMVAGLTFKLSKMGSFATEMNDDRKSVRLWWFLLFGCFINFGVVFLIGATLTTVLPLILVLYKRKAVIRFMYIVTYLPDKDYVFLTSIEDRQKKKDMRDELSTMEKGYYYFRKPKFMTSLVGYLLILLTPFALILILVPITVLSLASSGYDIPADFLGQIVGAGIQFAVIGIIAIIPFIILDLPIWGDKKLTRWTTRKLAPRLISTLSANKFSFGFFDGEYYIEEESMMLDMSESTGFFSIFKNGRLFSIIVTPLAFISILFRFILQTVDISSSEVNAADFLGGFIESVNLLNSSGNSQVSGIVFLGIIIIAPIVLSIILPLIWVISDAELKRATWYYNEEQEGYTYEINNVENVGKSLLNTFKIVLGVGAISALATNISIILQESTVANGWLITAVVVIIGSVLTLPGTFFMAYRYLASGDHARGVNIIRFSGSQRPEIGVGTISRNYKLEYKLLHPPAEIRELLGMEYDETIGKIVEEETEIDETPLK